MVPGRRPRPSGGVPPGRVPALAARRGGRGGGDHKEARAGMTESMRTVELIGAAIGEGAPDRRTRGGPGSLRQWGLGRRLSLIELTLRVILPQICERVATHHLSLIRS